MIRVVKTLTPPDQLSKQSQNRRSQRRFSQAHSRCKPSNFGWQQMQQANLLRPETQTTLAPTRVAIIAGLMVIKIQSDKTISISSCRAQAGWLADSRLDARLQLFLQGSALRPPRVSPLLLLQSHQLILRFVFSTSNKVGSHHVGHRGRVSQSRPFHRLQLNRYS